MFYPVDLEIPTGSDRAAGMLTLNPAESKRLIAKAVAALPEIRWAMENGRIIIGNGTTNAFVAEELLGRDVPKYSYAAGYIGRNPWSTEDNERLAPFCLELGQPIEADAKVFIRSFEGRDCFIKGANAVDPEGTVGILMANDLGGTIGMALGLMTARGANLIMPVGLEKLVAHVPSISPLCGITCLNYSTGKLCGLMPVSQGLVVTEIEALAILARVQATHVASGGIGGGEGSVVLVIEGADADVKFAFDMVDKLKGEPPVSLPH